MNVRRSLFILLLLTGLIAVSGGCASKKTITSSGFAYARLGNEMLPSGMERYKGIPLRDTVLEESDYVWRATIFEYKKGNVYVEEGFFESEIINRIRIETPELSLRNGLKVGMKVASLKEESSEWFVAPIPDYQLFDIYSRRFPRIHFIVRDPSRTMEDTEWENYNIADFDPESRVVAIVVF